MSPDNVFAAQMWAWPDAVIKRNAHGQVIVVNAAFLSLYGGQVEDWQGMVVQGWSAPPAPGEAIRFETRVPAAAPTDSGERVYDWIESALADGTSLAVARDVTAIQPGPARAATPAAPADAPAEAHTPPPPPATEPVFETVVAAAPAQQAPATDAPAAEATAVQMPAVEAPAAEASVLEAPIAEAPAVESPLAQAPLVPAHTPAPDAGILEMPPAVHESPLADLAPVDLAPADHAPAQPPPAEPMPAAAFEDTSREFERRALPIEDENAVLGNNWRDAVIAKAVGATGPEDDAAPASTLAVPEPAAEPTGAEGVRILLAEDNAINALLTRTLLEAEGCIVDTVEDGIYAVEAMKTKAYDLIFMDMRMPQMDGLVATRKIRAMDHASKGLPIVALTANAFDDDRNACFDAGMNDFMTKPVSAEELSEMVAAWTGPEAKTKLARAG